MTASPKDTDKRIGARVRAARVALGLSQSTIGEALNITYQQVQKYERGTNRLSVGTLQRIAEKLGLPASVFLDPEHRETDEDEEVSPALQAVVVLHPSTPAPLSAASGPSGAGQVSAEKGSDAKRAERRSSRRLGRDQRARSWQRFR